MKSLSRSLWALLLAGSYPAAADPHPACAAPFLALPDAATESLRAVAATCTDRSVVTLFYNRAYHADILSDLYRISGLRSYHRPSADAVRYEQARMFVRLAEAFAEQAYRRGDTGAIDALNAAYDQSIELVDFAIKGQDQFIGRREPPPAAPRAPRAEVASAR